MTITAEEAQVRSLDIFATTDGKPIFFKFNISLWAVWLIILSLALHSFARSLARSLNRSQARGKEVFVCEMIASISFSFNPLLPSSILWGSTYPE